MREILSTGAQELGITLSDEQLDTFDRFTAILLEWNQKFNLTRITEPDEIAVKHYLDSLSLLSVIEVPAGWSMIDVGTGAGFPAIPLKIAVPSLRITMLDSVNKRLSFLNAVIEELGLSDAKTVHGRAEDVAHEKQYREKFDFSVSRAVARLNVLAELCVPFCRVGGKFVSYKGPDVDPEVKATEKAFRTLGARLSKVHKFTLPHSDIQRSLVVVTKSNPTPSPYPRQAGTPERSPL